MGAPPAPPAPSGVYLHFPFCAIRCTYCDFATVAGQDAKIDRYLDLLIREIESFQQDVPSEVDSIFLGGGTPSRMRPEQVARLLEAVSRRFDLKPGCETTIECNPESLDGDKVRGYHQAGVNRLSLGVQSLDDRILKSVGRAHDAAAALEAAAAARRAGIPQLSVDLIAGLPGERLARWDRTLEQVAGLEPDHVSVYLLETDKDTPLARSIRHGRTEVDDDDSLADAYEKTVATLEGAGYELYEISNFAREGRVSRHNVKYWTDVPYAGFGLGAHAYAAGARRANRRDLDGYMDDLDQGIDPLDWADAWDPGRRLEEALVLGLRLREGVDLGALGARYDVDLSRRYAGAWERALAAGILEAAGDRVRLSAEGRLRSNALFSELIGSEE
ncbi:hypothetical protein ABI59_03590 [Acidobacteria bacterium Mor1]|nr:hypothetical protein ABI59_03590 [Acidobacteria bacterium Mor1]